MSVAVYATCVCFAVVVCYCMLNVNSLLTYVDQTFLECCLSEINYEQFGKDYFLLLLLGRLAFLY